MTLFGSLERRLQGAVMLATVLFNLSAGALVFFRQYHLQIADARVLVNLLVKSVSASASVGVYARNEAIADEVIASLFTSDRVAAVRVSSLNGFVREAGREGQGEWARTAEVIEYPLHSPLAKSEQVGTIELIMNTKLVQETALRTAGGYALLVVLQSVLLAAIIGVVVRRMIAQPIALLASQVDKLSVGRGERLLVSPNHASDEIGVLSGRINALVASADEAMGELILQREQVQAANLAKSRFLASASHDLRQPMHALNMYLGTLAGLPLPDKGVIVLGEAQRCAHAMDEMFRIFLDLSRLDAGVVNPVISVFPVQQLLAEIATEFRQAADSKGLSLRVVPSTAYVQTDLELVKNIVRNLVSNAIRYTDRGKVLIGCRRLGTEVRLEVHDTGRGLSVEDKGRIFEEFYQVGNNERNRAHGLGLGLAIVSRLTQLLQIPLTMQSVLGCGSTFAILLPGIAHDTGATSMGELPQSADLGLLVGAFVVVIDDEAAILDSTRAALELSGCEVVAAKSGQQAIRKLVNAERVPDILVCDYRLAAETSGLNAVMALHDEFCADIPVLIVTGDTDPVRITEFEALGLRVLHKPLQAQELRTAIAQQLHAARAG